MAITPTPNNSIYKGLVFDDIDSRDYGIYITGEAVFNSPERDVEMIEIPGRNGTYALDKGRFHNIEVTYPAGLFGGSEADFAAGIRAFRNALASRIGYKRLEDDYNPDEYRMAVYSAGLDVTPAQLKAGEFEITFDCKPQRFLKSGETAVSVASGGTITNPTLFEASPLLQVWGYGEMTINGEELEIVSAPIGNITLAGLTRWGVLGDSYSVTLNLEQLNTGDTIKIADFEWLAGFIGDAVDSQRYETISATETTSSKFVPRNTQWGNIQGRDSVNIRSVCYEEFSFSKGTSGTKSGEIYVNVGTLSFRYVPRIAYDGNSTFTFTAYVNETGVSCGAFYGMYGFRYINGVSSKSALGEPLYFDLDIGEAYKIEDGQTISVNNAVTIPAELPKLASGANTIIYDNTITQFKVVPRWWEV